MEEACSLPVWHPGCQGGKESGEPGQCVQPPPCGSMGTRIEKGVKDSLGKTREVSSSRHCPGCTRCLVFPVPPPPPPLFPSRNPTPTPRSPAPFLGSWPAQFSPPHPLLLTASRARDCVAPTPFIPPHFPPSSPPPRSASSPSPPSLGGAVSQAEGGRRGGKKGCLEKLPLPARGPRTRAAPLSRSRLPPSSPQRRGARAFGDRWSEAAAPHIPPARQVTSGSADRDAALALARKGAAALEPAGSRRPVPPCTPAPQPRSRLPRPLPAC